MTATGLSRNEVEALATKAARGSGLPWGVAEDLGRAARWLAARDLDWAAVLLAVLEAPAPVEVERLLAVVDRLAPGPVRVDGLPFGLVPALLAGALYGTGRAVLIVAAPLAIRLEPDGTAGADRPWPGRDAPVWTCALPFTVEVAGPGAAGPYPLAPARDRRTLDADAAARLERLAHQTTVPASAASRATGAGGARVDDD